MLLNKLASIRLTTKFSQRVVIRAIRSYEFSHAPQATVKAQPQMKSDAVPMDSPVMGELFPSGPPRVIPMVLSKRDPLVLSFDDVPGPRILKLWSNMRFYLSEIGTQITAGILTSGLRLGNILLNRTSEGYFKSLFDEYGPVVRFFSPVGRDIVLINSPEHIQKVYTLEGEHPIRSALDSLEKYRTEHRTLAYSGIYNMSQWKYTSVEGSRIIDIYQNTDIVEDATQGEDWLRQRSMVEEPLKASLSHHVHGLTDVCEAFTEKMFNLRNNQDEIVKGLYEEIHKWAFDCMGLLIFSKKFTMLNTEIVYSQCDMSWLYQSLQKSTEAIVKCESGMHLWHLYPTPAWKMLVKYCDTLDNLIGKHVLEAEQKLLIGCEAQQKSSLIGCMLCSKDKLQPEDIATVLMDMLLIGVNTVTSAMSFMMYYLGKHQKVQRKLYKEISETYTTDAPLNDIIRTGKTMPYMQACIKETLRLAPPIPVLTRVLTKNITLDRYNIPRGTLIIMANQDTCLKENNFDDAHRFDPDRWLKPDASEYHAFASIPFGFGTRRCLGQGIAENMMTLLMIKTLQRFKLEYHYGDIQPTRTFIAKPNKSIKLRFVDRFYN